MIKTIYSFVLIAALSISWVLDTQAANHQLDSSCYEYSAQITWHAGDATIKVKSGFSQFYPMQDGQLLNYRLLESGQRSDINYDVISRSYWNSEDVSNISDWDINTVFSFDPYDTNKKELIIDFWETLKANTFSSELFYRLGISIISPSNKILNFK